MSFITHGMRRVRIQLGYSLLELMVAIGITVSLMALALPSFASLVIKNEIVTSANAVIESLHFARSHAISHNRLVHVCQLDEAKQACSDDYGFNRDWSSGWMIFVDQNRNNDFDEGELLRMVKMNNRIRIVFNQRGRLRFFNDGSARSAGFYICHSQQSDSRHVYLLHTGRARVGGALSEKRMRKCVSA